ncbi:hypothetical protein Tco_1024409 [Tanacetum coccineum]
MRHCLTQLLLNQVMVPFEQKNLTIPKVLTTRQPSSPTPYCSIRFNTRTYGLKNLGDHSSNDQSLSGNEDAILSKENLKGAKTTKEKSLKEKEGAARVCDPKREGRKEKQRRCTEDEVSTAKEKLSTDSEKVSTDRPKLSTDDFKVSTDEQMESTDDQVDASEDIFEGSKDQGEGSKEKVESTTKQKRKLLKSKSWVLEEQSMEGNCFSSSLKHPLTKNLRLMTFGDVEKPLLHLLSNMTRKSPKEEWEAEEEKNKIAEEEAAK